MTCMHCCCVFYNIVFELSLSLLFLSVDNSHTQLWRLPPIPSTSNTAPVRHPCVICTEHTAFPRLAVAATICSLNHACALLLYVSVAFADCGMPPEYCEYSPSFEKCKPWLKEHYPHLYPALFSTPSEGAPGTCHAAMPPSCKCTFSIGMRDFAGTAAPAAPVAGAGVEGITSGVAALKTEDRPASPSSAGASDDDKKKPTSTLSNKQHSIPRMTAATVGSYHVCIFMVVCCRESCWWSGWFI